MTLDREARQAIIHALNAALAGDGFDGGDFDGLDRAHFERALAWARREPQPQRYILTGTWSGYVPAARHVVHRSIVPATIAEGIKLKQIVYSDDTTLDITLEPAKPFARVPILNSYAELIAEAIASGQEVFRV